MSVLCALALCPQAQRSKLPQSATPSVQSARGWTDTSAPRPLPYAHAAPARAIMRGTRTVNSPRWDCHLYRPSDILQYARVYACRTHASVRVDLNTNRSDLAQISAPASLDRTPWSFRRSLPSTSLHCSLHRFAVDDGGQNEHCSPERASSSDSSNIHRQLHQARAPRSSPDGSRRSCSRPASRPSLHSALRLLPVRRRLSWRLQR